MGTGIKREYRNALVINTTVLWIMGVNYSTLALCFFFTKERIMAKVTLNSIVH